ncbi:MAG: cadherin-like domain-containing protein [Rhodocyclaceae bacterium]|nr:cadherin-like domain-containing protein [Rhodocyclaceae bacterium]MBK6554469.1 cadherin-like domain-containing protein [Rhodocyclaceae bacterium]MBK6677575.1 cadherin-like domain-containing protein [Rhodocyclaceae bacterium]MBK9310250.1 cadherin-like domain-containing protein [Rhodocyclaceae bacterium]MCC8999811.1 cadherin-like domain-containing protein [Candidatus Contendobacter sp.]
MEESAVAAAAADPDGDALSIISFTQPSQAVGTVAQDGNRLVFRGAARFMSVTFTYTISDGHGGTSTATVTLIDP